MRLYEKSTTSLVGMVKERDNVHLTAQGYSKMVGSLLNSVNLIPKTEFGFHAGDRKPKKFQSKRTKSKNWSFYIFWPNLKLLFKCILAV